MTQFQPKPGIDWDDIRQRFEAGESSHSIAKTAGVVASSIRGRARKYGWTKPTENKPENEVALVLEKGALKSQWVKDLAKRTSFDAVKGAKMIHAVQLGASLHMAALMVGVPEATARDWVKASPDFDLAIDGARAAHAYRLVGYMEKAAERDWKAAERQLSVNRITKGLYSRGMTGSQGPAVQINVGVGRPKAAIGAEVIDITPA
jgi:hypothetical protein|tara:strand:+ start:69 stop:683 length:615 start_codon:yes stop_codon:yes gene_type:complete